MILDDWKVAFFDSPSNGERVALGKDERMDSKIRISDVLLAVDVESGYDMTMDSERGGIKDPTIAKSRGENECARVAKPATK